MSDTREIKIQFEFYADTFRYYKFPIFLNDDLDLTNRDVKKEIYKVALNELYKKLKKEGISEKPQIISYKMNEATK